MKMPKAIALLVWLWGVVLIPKALSIKCFSCSGNVNTKCESAITEIECHPNGNLVYDSCFTVTKVKDIPFIGVSFEEMKNCSVLSDCGFLEQNLCGYDPDGYVQNCSIDCCTGELCNGNTTVNVTSTVTHANVTNTIKPTHVISTIKHTNTKSSIGHANTGSTITHSNVNSTLTHSNVTSTLTHSNVTSTLAHANITKTLTHSTIRITIPHATKTSTIVHENITSTIHHANITMTLTHENVASTMLQASITKTITHPRYSGIKVGTSSSWKQIERVTSAHPTLETSKQELIFSTSSVTPTTEVTEPTRQVDAVYGGTERMSCQLTAIILLFIIFNMIKTA